MKKINFATAIAFLAIGFVTSYFTQRYQTDKAIKVAQECHDIAKKRNYLINECINYLQKCIVNTSNLEDQLKKVGK